MSEEAVRSAIADVVGETDPPAFRRRLETVVGDRPLTPAVLTARAARTVDGAVNDAEVAERAAAVQLSYEGLYLTRELIHEEPWVEADGAEADVDVIAAEVLVSHGVSLLAHSGVVEDAVAVVRRFGRDQTRQIEAIDERESTLERDTLELAVVAGADLAAGSVSPRIYEYADELAGRLASQPLPGVEALEGVETELEQVAGGLEVEQASRLDI